MSRLMRRSTSPLTNPQLFFREGRTLAVMIFPASFTLISAGNVASAVMMLMSAA